ncbi:MAG: starch-binding protein, partial [Lachnospiraceae bacterium]|nr:starch-binding protein [Lachnospiraceae bacterium]
MKKTISKIMVCMAGAILVSGGTYVGLQKYGSCLPGCFPKNNVITSQDKLVDGQALPLEVSSSKKDLQLKENSKKKKQVIIHYKWTGKQPHLHVESQDKDLEMTTPGVPMKDEKNGWYTYTVDDVTSVDMQLSVPELDYSTSTFTKTAGEYWYADSTGWSETAPAEYTEKKAEVEKQQQEVVMDAETLAQDVEIIVHYPASYMENASIYYWNVLPVDQEVAWPGKQMQVDADGYYTYTFQHANKVNFLFTGSGNQTEDMTLKQAGEYWFQDGNWTTSKPNGNTNNNNNNNNN